MSHERKNSIAVIGSYVSKYFGGTTEQGMGIVEDKLRFIRWERQLRLFDKANEILASRGIENLKKTIPQKFMLPLLEAATLEEDNYLQDKWVALLANAADDSHRSEVKRNYITILENMTAEEVEIFDNIIKEEISRGIVATGTSLNLSMYPEMVTTEEKNDAATKGELPNNIEVALNNLMRMGLLYDNTFGHSKPVWVCVSAMGREFHAACT